jgi:hypothetical protein
MFQLREINQMEWEMCQYLDWELNVEPSTLKEFEAMVRKDFAGPGPYSTYLLQTISKLANPYPVIVPNTSTSPIPVFSLKQVSSPKPIPMPPPIPANPAAAYISSPTIPDTPGQSYSELTSLASSASLATSTSMIDDTVKVVSHGSPGFSIDLAAIKLKMFAFAASAMR